MPVVLNIFLLALAKYNIGMSVSEAHLQEDGKVTAITAQWTVTDDIMPIAYDRFLSKRDWIEENCEMHNKTIRDCITWEKATFPAILSKIFPQMIAIRKLLEAWNLYKYYTMLKIILKDTIFLSNSIKPKRNIFSI